LARQVWPSPFCRRTARKALRLASLGANGLASVHCKIGNEEHRATISGYHDQIVYTLARDGTVIADDDAKVCDTDRIAMDSKTGKPVPDVTRYTYRDAGTRYVVSFKRERTILQAILADRARS
jgi:hypothetical protein